jgi:hypothetical protein
LFFLYQQLKFVRKDVFFIISVSLVYCSLSASFSLVSVFLPDKMILTNPIEYGSLNVKEITMHFVWGAIAGLVTLRLRYIILGGSLAVLIDSDHLIALLHMEGIPRMSHSITFAMISMIVIMLVFRRNDYRLGAITATSILTHISYDMFDGGYGFPILTPFTNKIIQLPRTDWAVFEIAAIIIIGIVSIITPIREEIKQ